MNPYLLLGAALALALASFTAYRHGVSTTETRYQLVIEKERGDAAEATRVAVAHAHEYERAQREALQAASESATAKARAEAAAARSRLSVLQRAIQEAYADPTVDAWRSTRIPEPIRVLIDAGDPNGAGGGGAR